MAVTYGFYNSLNGDRTYNAEQMSAIFDGIITDGVFSSIGGALMTIAGEGMQVLVKTGKAWFNGTWTLNDAQMALAVDAADVSLTRIDAVVLEVNSSISIRENSIKIVKGTPSANPTKPTMAADEDLHQYALAYITVGAGVTSITSSNIEVNVGKDSCPFITSVLQQTSITDLFNQWEGEFDTWFANVQSQLEGDVATNLQRQIDAVNKNIKISDTTKTQYGLNDTVIDPYLQFLGKYNEHWWSIIYDDAHTGEPVYEHSTDRNAYPDSGSGDPVYIENKTAVTSSDEFSLYYGKINGTITTAKSITIDTSGNITMVDPTTYSVSVPQSYTYMSTLCEYMVSQAPCYVSSSCGFPSDAIYYLPYGSTYGANSSYNGYDYTIFYNTNTTGSFSIFLGAGLDGISPAPYKISSKLSNDVTYEYLGVPFEKFPAMLRSKVLTYIGAGVYGSANPTDITFDEIPSIVIIVSKYSILFWHKAFPEYAQHLFLYNGSTINYYTISAKLNDNTLSLASGNAYAQANVSNITYTVVYFA